MDINEFSFLLTKEMERTFCMCNLALSNWPRAMIASPKDPVDENKACDHRTSKLNMAFGRVHVRSHTIHGQA